MVKIFNVDASFMEIGEGIVPPDFGRDAFNCPYCRAYAHQKWLVWPNGDTKFNKRNSTFEPNLYCTQCQIPSCKKYSYWYDGKMIYPPVCTAPMPADDMPEDCKKLYKEAGEIADKSARGAGALLRLCLEILLLKLGGIQDNNINQNIALLAAKEKISERVKKVADLCRLQGNALVHPSAINDEDNEESVLRLFKLINRIVENAITEPKELEAEFGTVPETQKEAIAKRDQRAIEKAAHKT